MTEFIQEIHQRTLAEEFNLPHANALQGLEKTHPQLAIRTERGLLAFPTLASRTDDHVPAERILRGRHRRTLIVRVHRRGIDHQHLDGAVRVGPFAQQTSRKDLRVVDDKKVVRRDVFDNVGYVTMLQHPGVPVQHHHLLGAALFGGMLGNETFGERIPELLGLHSDILYHRLRP